MCIVIKVIIVSLGGKMLKWEMYLINRKYSMELESVYEKLVRGCE